MQLDLIHPELSRTKALASLTHHEGPARSHGSQWHLARSARPPGCYGLWCSGWSALAPPGQLGKGPWGLVELGMNRGMQEGAVRCVELGGSRITHWSELSHSQTPRCCWHTGQPRSLGTRSVVGGLEAMC